MKKNNSIAATAADLQEIITLEMGEAIKKRVLFYLNSRDPLGMISPFQKEVIAEDAWVHVIAVRARYSLSKGATFKTWATKVARRFAIDQIRKLRTDPLHRSCSLYEEQPSGEDDAQQDMGPVNYYSPLGFVEDSSDQLHCREVLEALDGFVASYGGRDRSVAEMLFADRTKAEIMEQNQMTGGNVDVCICRVRKRLRSDLRKAGYNLAA